MEKTEHSCIPDIAQVDINRKMETCRKRVREETSIPVNKIFEEEILGLHEKGCDLVANIPKYKNVQSALCRKRRRILGTLQNPADSTDIKLPENLITLSNQESFLRLDFSNDVGKIFLVFAGRKAQNFFQEGNFFLSKVARNNLLNSITCMPIVGVH